MSGFRKCLFVHHRVSLFEGSLKILREWLFFKPKCFRVNMKQKKTEVFRGLRRRRGEASKQKKNPPWRKYGYLWHRTFLVQCIVHSTYDQGPLLEI